MLRRLVLGSSRAAAEATGVASLSRRYDGEELEETLSRLHRLFSSATAGPPTRALIPQLPRDFVMSQALFDKRPGTPEYAAAVAEVENMIARLVDREEEQEGGLSYVRNVRTPIRGPNSGRKPVDDVKQEVVTPQLRAELVAYWTSKVRGSA